MKGSFFEVGRETDTIYIAEGFADAQSIFECTGDLSIVAFSCSNMERVAEIFTGKYPDADIVIAGDADEAGIKNANEAALSSGSKVVFPCDTTGDDFVKDLNDLYAEQGKDAVVRLLEKAEYVDEAEVNKLKVVSVGDLIKMTLPERIYLLAPIIETKSLVMIHAYRGVGKTFLALQIAVAVASGTDFLHWRARSRHEVLYVDGEMPIGILKERLSKMMGQLSPDELSLNILSPDMQSGPMPDLSTEEGRDAIGQHISDRTELIVLDNLSTLVRGGRENDAESWQPVQDWILKMRREGIAVLLIHHSGKGKLQRGTSKREDVLDTVVCLETPKEYSADEGARFIVKFEKSRTMYGENTAPFEARLSEDKDGNYLWETDSAMPEKYAKALKLRKEGKIHDEIAKEIGVSQSTVSRRLEKAKAFEKASLKQIEPAGKRVKLKRNRI